MKTMESRTHTRFTKPIQSLVNWLLPATCVSCKTSIAANSSPACIECYQALPFHIDFCQQCGQSLPANVDVCGRCLEHSLNFDACFCAFRYEDPIDQHIRAFKYSKHPELAIPLAGLLHDELFANEIERPQLLLPVPIHHKRLRQRGFNQATELTRHLSKRLQIPYDSNLLEKHTLTEPQVALTHKQRMKNQRGSFRMKMQTNVKHVAIIDDVVTTGSTASEIAKILKRNGVDYVQVWGVAHTN